MTTLIFLAASLGAGMGVQKLEDPSSLSIAPGSVPGLPLDPALRTNLEEAMRARDYDRAEKLLAEEIERKPQSPELLRFLGNVFFLDGKYLNSAVAMKKADAIAPLDDRSRFILAMAYVTLEHGDWARPELAKLARSDPRNALYPYWLSRLDYDEMQLNSAVANLQKARQLDPNFMKAYDNLGLCYEALGKLDDAIHTYQEAIRLNREKRLHSPWPSMNLGALLVKLGKLEEAETSLRESLKEDPQFPKAHFQLGLLLEKQKKKTEAVLELEKAAELDPLFPEPHYALGRIYRRLGEEKNAEKAWAAFQELSTREKAKRVRRPR